VRVIEPSPPAVATEPWFADDPTARGELPPGRRLVSPVAGGDMRWADLARHDDELAGWCRERWLGPYRRLEPPPATLPATRAALHRVAEQVISPARRRANGKIGLRWTLGGFGTPFFGADAQVRVEGAQLVVSAAEAGERRAPLSTVAEAAAAIGFDLSGAEEQLERAPLEIDPAASHWLGDWFGFVTSVLEELRAEAPPEWEPGRVQIWPEHFDAAVELGVESADGRAALGGSPGDDEHAEPYLYVAPWTARPSGEPWNARTFTGAELSYAELLAAADQRGAALDFLRARVTALNP
jgi:hypothetical protein